MVDPLVSADIDLRDFAFMPLDVRRLLTSDTWIAASCEVRVASMSLWAESWHQVPAGSLPDNDRILERLSMLRPDEWERARDETMNGWVKCSDGRLYHPVVCDKALEAWDRKQKQRRRTAAATSARTTAPLRQRNDDRNVHQGTGTVDREKEGRKEEAQQRVRGTRLPPDWHPEPSLIAWAQSERTDLDVSTEVETFRDYWHARAGPGSVKLDWVKTFRNWIRNSHGNSRKANGHDLDTAARRRAITAGVIAAGTARGWLDDGAAGAPADTGGGEGGGSDTRPPGGPLRRPP